MAPSHGLLLNVWVEMEGHRACDSVVITQLVSG